MFSKRCFLFSLTLLFGLWLAGCQATSPQLHSNVLDDGKAFEGVESSYYMPSDASLIIKRTLVIGRIENQTSYSRSQVNPDVKDQGAAQVSELIIQQLVQTDNFLLIERPDLSLSGGAVKGDKFDLHGADTLLLGRLTKFERKGYGSRSHSSSMAKQKVVAEVEIQVVELKTGQVIAKSKGIGEADKYNSQDNTIGRVSRYDASLNDQALAAAVKSAVTNIETFLQDTPWSASIIKLEKGYLFTTASKSQGVKEGMIFNLYTKGERVSSGTSDTDIMLPGRMIGQIEIISLFGNKEAQQGSVARLLSGTLEGVDLSNVEIRQP